MCDCQERVAAEMRKLYPGAKVSGPYELLSGRSYSDYKIEIPAAKRKKHISVPVLHSFCPHCGQKYESEEEKPC